MIFCKSREFIFIRTSKNASTSLSLQIQKNLDFQPGDFATEFHEIPAIGIRESGRKNIGLLARSEHPNLSEFIRLGIIEEKEIENFSIYGVLREPVDRFFSLFPYFINTALASKKIDISELSMDDVASIAFEILEGTVKAERPHKYIEKYRGADRILDLSPQAAWLSYNGKLINNIVVYPNFDDMLIKLTGKSEMQFNEKVGTKPTNKFVSEATLQEIKKWYAPDFELWEKFGHNK